MKIIATCLVLRVRFISFRCISSYSSLAKCWSCEFCFDFLFKYSGAFELNSSNETRATSSALTAKSSSICSRKRFIRYWTAFLRLNDDVTTVCMVHRDLAPYFYKHPVYEHRTNRPWWFWRLLLSWFFACSVFSHSSFTFSWHFSFKHFNCIICIEPSFRNSCLKLW